MWKPAGMLSVGLDYDILLIFIILFISVFAYSKTMNTNINIHYINTHIIIIDELYVIVYNIS